MADPWERRAESFDRHPILGSIGIGVAILAICFVLAIVAAVGHFALGWWNGAAQTVGFDNTKAQFTDLYGDMESMRAAAANACAAKDANHSASGPTFLEDPAQAYEAKYRSIEADYNRRFENIFEANALLVKPNDLPQRAPTLDEMEAQVC